MFAANICIQSFFYSNALDIKKLTVDRNNCKHFVCLCWEYSVDLLTLLAIYKKVDLMIDQQRASGKKKKTR